MRCRGGGDQLQLEAILSDGGSADFIMGIAILNFAMKNSKSYVESVVKKCNAELKAAEKLRGPADIQKEKERKKKAEQAKKEQELQAAQEAYERTDVGTIRKNIKSAFEEWSTKGEFEKQADYDERLKSQSVNKFTQISIEQIKKISKYLYKYLFPYSPEKEHFTVKFRIGEGVEWQSEVNIPVAAAENFKKNFSDFYLHSLWRWVGAFYSFDFHKTMDVGS
jgi:hypothetical protein